MSKDPFYGVIAEAPKETDYQLGSDIGIVKRARFKFEDHKIQYNQKEVSPVSCTVHGAMGAYSSLTGYRFSLIERKEIWAEALKRGADPSIGWYTSRAVDLVRQYANERAKQKGRSQVTTFRVTVGSDEFFTLLRLGYSLVVSYRGNARYNTDKNDDGILDGVAFGESTYGHAIFSAYSVGDQYDQLIDNYVNDPSRPFNVYKVPSENFRRLIANQVFYSSAYVFIEEMEEDLESKIPIWAKSSYEKAIKKGLLKADDDIFREVGGETLENHLISLGIFSKREGRVSLIRWIVALDLMGQLN